MNKFYTIVGFLLISTIIALGNDSIQSRKVKILPVPAFGYSPETGTYIGAVSLFTFDFYKDSTTRTSNARIELNYTWEKQLIMECGWNYFFNQEKWFTKGLIHYSYYPDLYYGIGPTTPQSNELIYTSNRLVLEGAVLKKIGHRLFTGTNAKYIRYSNLNTEASAINYPELTNGSTFGIGYSILKDTRNNLLTPTHGAYLYFNSSYNFSRNNYWEFTLDLRYYKTWKNKFTLASRFINDLNVGNVPFYDLAIAGGDKFVRGYYFGRYRDNNLGSLQTEFRFPVYRRWGLATFGGLSDLYSENHPFQFSHTKMNYGVGIRFLVDKKDRINLRMDYAIGNDHNNGFYISFGESF